MRHTGSKWAITHGFLSMRLNQLRHWAVWVEPMALVLTQHALQVLWSASTVRIQWLRGQQQDPIGNALPLQAASVAVSALALYILCDLSCSLSLLHCSEPPGASLGCNPAILKAKNLQSPVRTPLGSELLFCKSHHPSSTWSYSLLIDHMWAYILWVTWFLWGLIDSSESRTTPRFHTGSLGFTMVSPTCTVGCNCSTSCLPPWSTCILSSLSQFVLDKPGAKIFLSWLSCYSINVTSKLCIMAQSSLASHFIQTLAHRFLHGQPTAQSPLLITTLINKEPGCLFYFLSIFIHFIVNNY